jgi:hypothetical protein
MNKTKPNHRESNGENVHTVRQFRHPKSGTHLYLVATDERVTIRGTVDGVGFRYWVFGADELQGLTLPAWLRRRTADAAAYLTDQGYREVSYPSPEL